MKSIFLDFLSKLPVATMIYFLLVLFADLSFDFKWLTIAIVLDAVDWLVSEI
ncbi:MAG: hypothetical protein QW818_02755 [Candidatus Aenigmatarchaeota archaeon]|nr:hypothetical protein [Candidatus Aenigmarchaeota archaeon]